MNAPLDVAVLMMPAPHPQIQEPITKRCLPGHRRLLKLELFGSVGVGQRNLQAIIPEPQLRPRGLPAPIAPPRVLESVAHRCWFLPAPYALKAAHPRGRIACG